MSRDRHRAEAFGRRAETLAAAWLWLKGYEILARDFRSPVGEIDLIARKGGNLAFIEVKARTSGANPDALTPRQGRRIARAAEAYLAMRPGLARLAMRFDLILISPGGLPRHLRGAWRADD